MYLLVSYFIGCFMTAFWVGKLFGQQDIRTQGSGNVGARNIGRVHGKKAFMLTFLGDAIKGVIVILLARYIDLSAETALIGLFFAILGHIKPITLKFKGGKGISTFIGGIITFEPISAVAIIAGFLLVYPFIKSFTLAGLSAFLLIPLTILYLDYSFVSCTITIIILAMLYWAHIENIKERLKKHE